MASVLHKIGKKEPLVATCPLQYLLCVKILQPVGEFLFSENEKNKNLMILTDFFPIF
jgi:hypothetical protein